MNIAITSLYLPTGSKIGVGYQVHYLANALVRRGHSVTVFSQSGASSDALYSVVVVVARKRFRTFGFAWDLRQCDFSGFDVLNAHGDDWLLWGKKRPRHIHTFHGSCFAEMLHATGVIGRMRMAALAACEYSVCFLPDELVAVSENTRHYIPFVKHVIPCGVNMDEFWPGDKSETPSLLFVGTIKGRKRGAMLLDLFQREIRPRVHEAEFWAVCEEPVGGDGVRWFGRIPIEKLGDLFRRAWVFCLPSITAENGDAEGLAIVLLEAQASGVPVITSRFTGTHEGVAHGRTGFAFPERDVDDLAAKLTQVLLDDALADSMSAAGPVFVAQKFDIGACTRDLELLYDSVQRASIAGRPAG